MSSRDLDVSIASTWSLIEPRSQELGACLFRCWLHRSLRFHRDEREALHPDGWLSEQIPSQSGASLVDPAPVASVTADQLIREVQVVAASRPPSLPQMRAALALALHRKLRCCRQLAIAQGNDEGALTNLGLYTDEPRRAAGRDSSAAMLGLPLSVQIGIRLFFRLLYSLQHHRHVPGLLKLVHQLPPVLNEMPPLALASVALRRVSRRCAQALDSETVGVVEAISSAVEGLARHPQRLAPNDYAAVLTAAVALAVKCGALPHVLSTIRLLLFGASGDEAGGILEPETGGGVMALFVAPYLRELADAAPEPPPTRQVAYDCASRGGGTVGNGSETDIPSAGLLMTFGKGDHGKLGHGWGSENKLVPTFVEALRTVELIRIDSLSTHSVAVTLSGELLAWGNGDKNRLGHGTTEKQSLPRVMRALTGKPPVADVACGLGHTLALLVNGQLFSWGNGGNGRLGLGDTSDRATACHVAALQDVRLAEVFCGASHSLAVACDGRGFSWGKNNQGQCGHGTSADQPLPLYIEGMGGSLVALAGGWEHTLALRRDGHVLSFGAGYKDSRRGAVPPVLGHGDTERHVLPKVIEALHVRAVHIACGWDHSMAVSSDGELFTWGSGSNGKLGHGDDENRSVPTRVEALSGTRILQVGGGCEHTAAITVDGELYTWGHGDSGRLGHGSNSTERQPRRVDALVWQRLRVVALAVGDKYNMLLVQSHSDAASVTLQRERDAEDDPDAKFNGRWLRAVPQLQVPDKDSHAIGRAETALVLLVHLERLASRYLPQAWRAESDHILRQKIQRVLGDGASCSPSPGEKEACEVWPYAVDTSVATFELFVTLLKQLRDGPRAAPSAVGHDGFNPQDALDDACAEKAQPEFRNGPASASYPHSTGAAGVAHFAITCLAQWNGTLLGASSSLDHRFQYWAILWCTLRVLKSNMYCLLTRTTGAHLTRQRSSDKAPDGDRGARPHSEGGTSARARRKQQQENDDGALEEKDDGTNEIPLSRRGSKGDELLDSFEDKPPEGGMPAGVDVSPEMQAAIWNSFEVKQADLEHILQDLHHLLYEILDTHSYLNAASFAVGTEAIESLQAEAADILSVGFRLFYPSTAARIALLRSLVAPRNTGAPALLCALVDQICLDEHMAALISEVFLANDTTTDPEAHKTELSEGEVMTVEELDATMYELLQRCKAELEHYTTGGCWATPAAPSTSRAAGGGASPNVPVATSASLKLLLTLQTHLLSHWADRGAGAEKKASAFVCYAAQHLLLKHAEHVMAEAIHVLDNLGAVLSSPDAEAGRLGKLLRGSFLGRLVPLLATSIGLSQHEPALVVQMLPWVLSLVRVLDQLNVRIMQNGASCAGSQDKEEPPLRWLVDLESTLALTASKLACSLVEGPAHTEDEQQTHSWLNTSRLLALGDDNWPSLTSDISAAGLEQMGGSWSMLQTVSSWKAQGVYSVAQVPAPSGMPGSDVLGRSTATRTSHGARLNPSLLEGGAKSPSSTPPSGMRTPSPSLLRARASTPNALKTMVSADELETFLDELVLGRSAAAELDAMISAQRLSAAPSQDAIAARHAGNRLKGPSSSSAGALGKPPLIQPSAARDARLMWAPTAESSSEPAHSLSAGLDDARRAITAVLIKANGSLEDAVRLSKMAGHASQGSGVTTPPLLLAIWRTAQHINTLLLRTLDHESEAAVVHLNERVVANCRFLLKATSLPPIALLNNEPVRSTSPQERLRKWSRANPRSNWRTLQGLLSVLHSWKARVRSETSETLLLDASTPARQSVSIEELVLFLAATFKTDGLLSAMRQKALRAQIRAVGFDILQHLLTKLSFSDPRCQVVSALANVVGMGTRCSGKSAFPDSGAEPTYVSAERLHFLDDLGGAGPPAIMAVRHAFSTLYETLSLLVVQTPDRPGDSAAAIARDADALKLQMLHAWALKITPAHPRLHFTYASDDCWQDSAFAFVAESSIISLIGRTLAGRGDVLEHTPHPSLLLDGLRAAPWPSRVLEQALGTTEPSLDFDLSNTGLSHGGVLQRQAMHHAAWHVLHLLAIQLCTETESPDSRVNAPGLSSAFSTLSPPPVRPRKPSSSTADESEDAHSRRSGQWHQCLESLFSVLFDEVTRVQKELQALSHMQKQVIAIHASNASQVLLRGPTAIVTGPIVLPDVVADDSSALGFSISFWLWLASTDDTPPSVGARGVAPSPAERNQQTPVDQAAAQERRILVCARTRESGRAQQQGEVPNEVLETSSHPGVFLVQQSAPQPSEHHSSAMLVEFVTLAVTSSAGDADTDTVVGSNQESSRRTDARTDAPHRGQRSTVLVTQALRSPQAVPTGRWVHVCCSYDTSHRDESAATRESSAANMMHLFIDGQLVAERRTEGDAPHVLANEMVVGRVMHQREAVGATATSPESSGTLKPSLKGAIADLSWHRRPFQPGPGQLQLLVQCGVRSQREEHHAEVGYYCVRLVSLLQSLASTERGAKFLATSSWMFLLLQLVRVCGATAQRVTLRLFRVLMAAAQPTTLPAHMPDASAAPSQDPTAGPSSVLAGSGANVASAMRKGGPKMAIIEQLCYLLGSALFSSASMEDESAKLHALGQEDDAMPLRYTSMPSSDSLINIDRFSLVSEIVMLLRSLLSCPGWNEELASSFGAVLATLPDQLVYRWDGQGTCKRTVRDTACDPRRVGEELGMILAAIYVMGGHVEGPRVGAHVVVPAGTEANSGAHAYKVQCTCRGTIARCSSEAGQAFVLVERRHVECVVGQHDKPASEKPDPDRDGMLAVILPIHQLVFEVDVAEQPELLPLPELAVPAFSFLLEIQPCLDGQSTEETEAATSVSETASSSSGALPAAGDPQTTADSTSAASDEQLAYDAVLLCAHTRCHALRALALQMQHPESAVVALRGGLLTPLLTLATTDLAAAPALALGRDAGAAMHLPVVSSLASKLSKMISCTELQSFAQRIWARIPLAPPATRTPWLRARAAMHLKQTLEPLGGEVAIEGFRVRAVSHFPTVRLKGISLCSGEGRWYYEVVLLTDGLMQIGWCDPFFRCDPVRGQGVGDHVHSWAFDGFRQKKWCVSSAPYGERWRMGDVLGVLLDLDLLEMRFFLNGRDLGAAFVGIQAEGLFPGASLNVGQAARFNFGHAPFLHPPSTTDGLPFHAVAEASGARGLSSSRILRSVGRADMAHHTFEEHAGSRHGSRGVADGGDEEMTAELEIRRQTLIENLIGMGFPVEWAIRAAEHCDVTLNESMAIAWIIERMEMENAKMEAEVEGCSTLRYADEGDEYDGEDGDGDGDVDGDVEGIGEGAGDVTDRGEDEEYRFRYGAHDDITNVSEVAVHGELDAEEVDGLIRDDDWGCEDLYKENYFLPASAESAGGSGAKTAMGLASTAKTSPSSAETNALPALADTAVDDELVLLAAVACAALSILYARAACVNLLAHAGVAMQGSGGAGVVPFDGAQLGATFDYSSSIRNEPNSSSSLPQLISNALVEPTCQLRFLELMKLLVFRGVDPPDPLEGSLSTLWQWLSTFSVLEPNHLGCDPRPYMHARRALAVGLHPTCCLGVIRQLLAVLANPPDFLCASSTSEASQVGLATDAGLSGTTTGPTGSSTASAAAALLDAAPRLISLLIDEAVAHFERARQKDFDHIPWAGPSRMLLAISDRDALTQPNLEWATWILDTIMCLGEEMLSSSRTGRLPVETTLRAVSEVFSAGVFGSLLNVARSSNMALRHLAFRLCGHILHRVRLQQLVKEADFLSGASTTVDLVPSPAEDFLSISRERRLMQMFSSRLRKESTTRILFSSYLQSLGLVLVQWQRLREAMGLGCELDEAETHDGADDGDPSAPPYTSQEEQDASGGERGPDLVLVVEEISHTAVTLSWGEWSSVIGVDAVSSTSDIKGDGSPLSSTNHGVGAEVRDMSTHTLQVAACSTWGAEPFAEAASGLPCRGCFTVEGLEPDTRYRFRLSKLTANPATILTRETAPETAAESSEQMNEADGNAPTSAAGGGDAPALAAVVDSNLISDEPHVHVVHSRSITVCTFQETLFMLNPDATGPNLTLSNGNLTVTNKVNKKWNACRATTCFSSGMHSWDVHVDKCVSKNIFIGVMGVESSLDNYVGSDKFGWGYLANKAIWHNKGKVRSYGELFKEGDTIGVHLDMDVGNLWFSRNGRDLGIAVEGLHGELYPAFSLYNKDDQLSLVPPDCGNSSATYSIIGGTALAESTIHRMAQALNLLEYLPTSPQPRLNYANQSSVDPSGVGPTSRPSVQTLEEPSAPVPTVPRTNSGGSTGGLGPPQLRALSPGMARCIWQRWRRWQQAHTTRILTAQGTPIDVDTSAEACSAFGLFHGEKVKFNKGVATVLGVAKHCLWYSLEGSTGGALCWSRRTAHDIVLQPAEYQLSSRTGAAPRDRTAAEGASDKLYDDVPIETMLAWFAAWTPEMDAQLCEHVNALVEAQGSPPFHLAYDAIELPNGASAPSLAGVSLPQIRARMALLVHLNDLLNPLLPLIDFSLTRSSCSPAHLLARNRYRLFSSIKGVVLGKLLQQTATPTPPPKDEYAHPDLLKFTIEIPWEADPGAAAEPSATEAARTSGDRPTSVTTPAKAWLTQEAKNSSSCFGQANKLLSAVQPCDLRRHCVLRRTFVDDAQECAFKVTFVGGQQSAHGSTGNHSASYRAFFRRVCAEVQSPTVPLFVPCPNSIKEKQSAAAAFAAAQAQATAPAVGTASPAGSGRRPLCMVNLAFCTPPGQMPLGLDPGRIAMYRTFGQLMGIALRTHVPLPLTLPSIIWRPLVGEDLSRDDLLSIDSDVVALLEYFEHLEALGVTSDNFEQLIGDDLRFVAPLSGGTSVELLPGGQGIKVQYDNARLFATRLERVRLSECIPMVAAIYEGLISVVPRHILPLFTWRELELLVSGRPLVDVSLLRECASFGSGLDGSEAHVKVFWSALEDLSIAQRTALLRLLWSDLLPPQPHRACATTLPAPFVIVDILHATDSSLPRADASTHSLSLPRYSSRETCRDRLVTMLGTVAP